MNQKLNTVKLVEGGKSALLNSDASPELKAEIAEEIRATKVSAAEDFESTQNFILVTDTKKYIGLNGNLQVSLAMYEKINDLQDEMNPQMIEGFKLCDFTLLELNEVIDKMLRGNNRSSPLVKEKKIELPEGIKGKHERSQAQAELKESAAHFLEQSDSFVLLSQNNLTCCLPGGTEMALSYIHKMLEQTGDFWQQIISVEKNNPNSREPLKDILAEQQSRFNLLCDNILNELDHDDSAH